MFELSTPVGLAGFYCYIHKNDNNNSLITNSTVTNSSISEYDMTHLVLVSEEE